MYSVFKDSALSNAEPGSKVISCKGKGSIRSLSGAASEMQVARQSTRNNLGDDMAAKKAHGRK